MKTFYWGRQCFRAMRANTGARYVTARRAMDIARAKVARTTPTVGTHPRLNILWALTTHVPTVGIVHATFARAMSIARRAVT